MKRDSCNDKELITGCSYKDKETSREAQTHRATMMAIICTLLRAVTGSFKGSEASAVSGMTVETSSFHAEAPVVDVSSIVSAIIVLVGAF